MAVFASDVMEDDDLDCAVDSSGLTLDPEKERQILLGHREIDKAKYHLERFFNEHRLHTGGQITKSFLFNERRMYMVMNYDIMRGVDHAYRVLEGEFDIVKNKTVAEITQDIRLVIDVLNLLSRSGVPQEYAGGMLCVYLELVEGVKF